MRGINHERMGIGGAKMMAYIIITLTILILLWVIAELVIVNKELNRGFKLLYQLLCKHTGMNPPQGVNTTDELIEYAIKRLI